MTQNLQSTNIHWQTVQTVLLSEIFCSHFTLWHAIETAKCGLRNVNVACDWLSQ